MIHETAIIGSGSKIGKDVSIGPFSYIENDVSIGDGCKIGPHVSILRYTTLGKDCEVHAGAVIGDAPQDTGFEESETYVRIGDGCRIREGVTIHRGTKPGTATEIGDRCFLMAFSHCAHNVKLGNDVVMANGVLLAGYVEVGEKVFFGGNTIVHQFVKIGRMAMLGGGCAVNKELLPFCTTRPVALNDVAGINAVGMKRAGMKKDDLAQVKAAFKIFYNSDLNVTQAIEKIEQDFQSGPAREMSDFAKQSERGIC